MTDSMIERVSARIWAVESSGELERREDEELEVWAARRIRTVARVAIEAMREPTEAMLEVGGRATGDGLLDDKPGASLAWQAMINAALATDSAVAGHVRA